MTDETRLSTVEKMRAEVEKTVQASREAMHRGIDAKYNLLRVSERRWSIVRVASTATITFGIPDVVTFEQVTGPLAFDAALAELRRRRNP
jgi:hypothetical protein